MSQAASPLSISAASASTRHTVRRPTLEKWVRRGLQGLESLSPRLAGKLAFQVFLTPLRDYFPVSESEKAVLHQAEANWLTFQSVEFGIRRNHCIQTYTWHPPQRQSAPTVLLLHGWMASSSHMGSLVRPLLEDGFRVVALDAPAHGRSKGFTSDMPAFASALRQVVQRLGPVEGIVAHSFGAASCLYLLHESPSCIAVNNLVLLAPPSEISLMMDIVVKAVGASSRLRTEMEQRFVQRYGNPSAHYVVARMAEKLSLPCLVIHDRDDRLIPFSEGETIAQNLPQGELIATRGLGHGGILRDPDIIKRIIQFQRIHQSPRSLIPLA